MLCNMLLLILNAVKCNLMELTTRSTNLAVWIPYVAGPKLYISAVLYLVSIFLSVGVFLGVGALFRGCFPSPFPPSFHIFISVTGAYFFFLLCGGLWLCYQDVRAKGVVSIWLPIVEAPGCLRHPTSTLLGGCKLR